MPLNPTFEIRGHYTLKDQAKSNKANKFIGQGSAASSTNAYAKAWGELANCGQYLPTDIVFISAEGNRRDRLKPNYEEILLAIDEKVTFITDIPEDRNRPYNAGERSVENYLKNHSYHEVSPGVWKPKPAPTFT